jgi:hypothetical protein
MAVGLPMKTTYANGDVLSASDVNDITGTINANVNPYCAGKNKIINGDFYVNQRNFSSITADGWMFDRYLAVRTGNGTSTYTAQTFTLGTAPVAGYSGKNYLQVAVAGESSTTSYTIIQQHIEDVRTLAGSTATISFWAKANTGTPNILTYVQQQFGTGGSPSATVNTYGTVTAITTSWARYTFTISVPSISGKTIGTNNNSYLTLSICPSAGSANGAPFTTLGIQNNTFQFWGLQIEQGSTATPFQTATGSIQGELAACQRYYQRFGGETAYQTLGSSYNVSTTKTNAIIALPVPMRVIPTSLDSSTLCIQDSNDSISGTLTSVAFANAGNQTIRITGNSTGMTDNLPGALLTNNSTSGYIGFSAELSL